MSEDAVRSMLVDVDFMKDQFESIGRPEATSAFRELRMVRLTLMLKLLINPFSLDDINRT